MVESIVFESPAVALHQYSNPSPSGYGQLRPAKLYIVPEFVENGLLIIDAESLLTYGQDLTRRRQATRYSWPKQTK